MPPVCWTAPPGTSLAWESAAVSLSRSYGAARRTGHGVDGRLKERLRVGMRLTWHRSNGTSARSTDSYQGCCRYRQHRVSPAVGEVAATSGCTPSRLKCTVLSPAHGLRLTIVLPASVSNACTWAGVATPSTITANRSVPSSAVTLRVHREAR